MILRKGVRLTKAELEIMNAFWELGAASVREVQENLPARKRPAYTTVQTVVYRLEEKGALRKVKRVGNAQIFEPAITQKAAHRRLIDDLIDLLDGSTRPLMAHLIESGKLSLEDLREVESRLMKQESEPPEGGAGASAEGKAG
ncbi:MAG TPA: BlaI/MecI/CopY family transcriptional regulator [Pyrinomonadaceae bacterium]|nr:BlaI/MecI/CopY family transcriptional regulator [Pyrinomonadaceae bacterium]